MARQRSHRSGHGQEMRKKGNFYTVKCVLSHPFPFLVVIVVVTCRPIYCKLHRSKVSADDFAQMLSIYFTPASRLDVLLCPPNLTYTEPECNLDGLRNSENMGKL
jgi:hypothetical protein